MENLKYYKAKPNKTIAQHTDDLLKQLESLLEYGYIKDQETYKRCHKACELHDIGKINRRFQERVSVDKKIKFDPQKEVPHNILSGYMMEKDAFENQRDYLLVLRAVLYHHDYVDVCQYIKEEGSLIQEALNEMGIRGGISGRDLGKLSKMAEDQEAIRIKGILHKCDYSASAELPCEYKTDFLQEALQDFIVRLQSKNKQKKIAWNEMQEYCRANQESNLLVVAQTGMGKTEGALNWIGNQKGFFILPLRTAINAIYDRVKDEIISNVNTRERVAILHSSSLTYYMKQSETASKQESEEILEYEKIGKQWSLPLSITTMDQIFDFTFKYQGYELKLATLAYSKVVVDEIQMYDPQLLAYLIYGLEQISAMGGRIAIITATLPPFIEGLLSRKINFKPRVEFYNESMIRHNIKVKQETINAKDIYEKFQENVKLGRSNKILVICNTVRKARELYTEIKEMLEVDKVHILHSRFIQKDRSRLEKEIKEFGRTYDANGEIDLGEGIWVSTSLVEASLDIDFDYLFTELQDLSSLFQRLGRCNRKGEKSIAETNCYVYTEIEAAILTHGNKGFIDKKMYELSKAAIKDRTGLLSEKEKIELIRDTFTTENVNGSDYLQRYKETYAVMEQILPYKFDKKDIVLRDIFAEEVIPAPVYRDNISEIEELIEKLNSNQLERYERILMEDKLREYTVSIPSYEMQRYKKAVIQNKAELYKELTWGRYNKVGIIDCEYDSRGFVPKAFESIQTGEGEFL